MKFTMNKAVELLIAERMINEGFATPAAVVEFALFAQCDSLRPFFETRSTVDAALLAGGSSGPAKPLEQPDSLRTRPPTRILATPAARSDLIDIWNTLGTRQTLNEAERYVILLSSQLVVLAAFPDLGTQWRGRQLGIRVFRLGEFGIFFHPVLGGIEILRMLPLTMNIPPVQ